MNRYGYYKLYFLMEQRNYAIAQRAYKAYANNSHCRFTKSEWDHISDSFYADYVSSQCELDNEVRQISKALVKRGYKNCDISYSIR